MKRTLALFLCALVLTGCGVSDAVGSVAEQIKDSVQEAVAEKLESAGETIDSIKSGDLGILGIVPDPNKFAIGANTYTLGEVTVDELREKNNVGGNDGTFMIFAENGMIAFQADDAGVVTAVMITTESCTAYMGIKVGAKRSAVRTLLGKPTFEETNVDEWIFPEYQTMIGITWSQKKAEEIWILPMSDFS